MTVVFAKKTGVLKTKTPKTPIRMTLNFIDYG